MPDSRNPDPRRTAYAPPVNPTEVFCTHCHRVFQSWQLVWRNEDLDHGMILAPGGAWCCPTHGCDGIGFQNHIWPTDPDWHDELNADRGAEHGDRPGSRDTDRGSVRSGNQPPGLLRMYADEDEAARDMDPFAWPHRADEAHRAQADDDWSSFFRQGRIEP